MSAEQAAVELGQELRQARCRLGLSIDVVSASLRVRRGYIEALENGAWSELPSQMHARCFARNYAVMLGLDPVGYAAALHVNKSPAPKGNSMIALPGRPRRASPPALAAIACGLAAYLIVTLPQRGDSRTTETPEVPAHLGALAEVQTARGSLHFVAAPGQAGGLRSDQGLVAQSPVPEPPSQPLQSEVPTTLRGDRATDAIMSRRVELQIASDSREGVWVRVRLAHSREVVMARVLRPGEVWRVPPRAGLLLDAGKAHEIRVLVDGSPVPMKADMRGVRRGVVLSDLLPGDLQGAANGERPLVRSALQDSR
jgi:cytoskeleton protein RodZ